MRSQRAARPRGRHYEAFRGWATTDQDIVTPEEMQRLGLYTESRDRALVGQRAVGSIYSKFLWEISAVALA